MKSILNTALMLRELGFAVHWLLPKSKAPASKGWATAPIATIADLEKSYRNGYNVGFRPGKYSVVDGCEIIVLDVDIRGGTAYAQAAYDIANEWLDGKFDPTVQTGSIIGRHQYLKAPIGQSPNKAATTIETSNVWVRDGVECAPKTDGGKPAFVVEVLSTGKNVVLPPSIHPDTKMPYTWLHKDI
jgi:hypothetical protein